MTERSDSTEQAAADRARFTDEVARKARWLTTTLGANISAGRLDASVAVAALVLGGLELARTHGLGAPTADWLRAALDELDRLVADAAKRAH